MNKSAVFRLKLSFPYPKHGTFVHDLFITFNEHFCYLYFLKCHAAEILSSKVEYIVLKSFSFQYQACVKGSFHGELCTNLDTW